MQLNCKVIKKVATPTPPTISTSIPLFQSYPPFLANFLVPPPPQMTQFLEVPTSPPPLIRGRGVPTMECPTIIKLFSLKNDIHLLKSFLMVTGPMIGEASLKT